MSTHISGSPCKQAKSGANTDDFESLLQELDLKGIPRDETIVRYIDPDPPTLIL